MVILIMIMMLTMMLIKMLLILSSCSPALLTFFSTWIISWSVIQGANTRKNCFELYSLWTSSVKQTILIPDKIDLRSPDQKKAVRYEANFIYGELLLRDRVLRHLVHNAPGSCDHGGAGG